MRSAGDQFSAAPSGVFDHSNARMRSPISPPPIGTSCFPSAMSSQGISNSPGQHRTGSGRAPAFVLFFTAAKPRSEAEVRVRSQCYQMVTRFLLSNFMVTVLLPTSLHCCIVLAPSPRPPAWPCRTLPSSSANLIRQDLPHGPNLPSDGRRPWAACPLARGCLT